ncbi:hypothetical protein [Plastoroseomonas arctica]|uniref:Uncharacterized protein n=1 Tax=Plastoroseomonas arctica TaxID=1509237 RepID=A0AAF1JX07_9PROT|nr:hypothetical protein [Plastoroseomonas arctica]MBR0655762.1 hypothetical protein [Plastoroseomonas arctica]
MASGPGAWAGAPGVEDGRLDVLLDTGAYKLRTAGAPGATDTARLTIEPFQEAAVPASIGPGLPVSGELRDLQQRSVWFTLGARRSIRLEAAGRALGDLRIWTEHGELVAADPTVRGLEPRIGRSMRSILLAPVLEAGTYRVTAYGGASLPWANGESAVPFLLRMGWSDALDEGAVAGRIGPFGSEVFEVTSQAGLFRLTVPAGEAATLRLRTGEAILTAAIAAESRAPSTALRPGPRQAQPRYVEIHGREGQAYSLRALGGVILTERLPEGRTPPPTSTTTPRPAPDWRLAEAAGFGGDEVPPTLILAHQPANNGPVVILASHAPRISAAAAWRASFNLRGPSSLFVEVSTAGPILLQTRGVALGATLQPVLAPAAQDAPAFARADGEAATAWNVAAGWYLLRLTPVRGAEGVLDLTIGPPGLQPPSPTPPLPPDPVLDLGQHAIAEGGTLRLAGGSVPGGAMSLITRSLPLDLGGGAVVVTQLPGVAMQRALAPVPADEVAVMEVGGGRLRVGTGPDDMVLRVPPRPAAQDLVLTVPARPVARNLVIARRVPVPPAMLPTPRALPALSVLTPERPFFFDLARGGSRSFGVTLAQGGFYRVETLGRLRTTGSLGTAFVAVLEQATGNGVGENMLIQRNLGVGTYRVSVTAEESSGRLGLLVRPLAMQQAALLLPGATSRASLPAGTGLTLPIDITEAATYRLDLLSLGRAVTARIEDADGWPLLPAGELDGTEQELARGRYRLVVLPADVASRVVARLMPLGAPAQTAGHGPHALGFGAAAQHEWREPSAPDAPRAPDLWDFTLPGPSPVTLSITEGMGAELHRLDAAHPQRIGALADGSNFVATLAAGPYRVSARALARNDRLPYRLTLSSTDLQPDAPREVTLPATLAFAIEAERVVNITSAGATDIRATLRDAEGRVVLREDDRADDWNIAISRRLPSGRYLLELAPAVPLAGVRPAPGADDGDDESDEPRSTPRYTESNEAEEAEPGRTTIQLTLPASLPSQPVSAEGAMVLQAVGVHHLTLPEPPSGSLFLATAEAAEEVVLSLELQGTDGTWRPLTSHRGNSVVVAVPAEPGMVLRAVVWRVDGRAVPIRFAWRNVSPSAQSLGQVLPVPTGLGNGLHVALVTVPQAALVTLQGEGLLQASSVSGLVPVVGGIVAPQSERLWLLAPDGTPLQAVGASIGARPLVLTLGGGQTATLPAGSSPARLWLAETGGDIAALDAGRGMGVAPGSSLALAGDAWLRLRNAAGPGPLRVALRAIDPTMAPTRQIGDGFRAALAGNTAQPLSLPPGSKRLRLDLPSGAGAVLGWRGPDPVTVWAGDTPLSRMLDGEWSEMLLVNTGTQSAPMVVQAAALGGPVEGLRAGQPLRRFFGAAGSIALPVEATPGTRLRVAGARRVQLLGADGTARSGVDLRLVGPGLLVLDHSPGPILAWLGEAEPFPDASLVDASLPSQLPLAGPTMALRLAPATPVLLQARTTGPVVLALGGTAPEVFPAGAEFQRYLPAGPTTLRLMAPQDGPLSGTLELSATPVLALAEGIGEPVLVAPGGTALFGFDLTRGATIGLGVRAVPDRVAVRILAADGTLAGEGVAQLRRLPPGRYLIEARVPADAATTEIRPAIIGLVPRPSGPPAEIARQYQALTGVLPAAAR